MSLPDFIEYFFMISKPLLRQNDLRLNIAWVCKVSYRRSLLVFYLHLQQLLLVPLIIIN